MTDTADNIDIKDNTLGTSRTVRSTVKSNAHYIHHIVRLSAPEDAVKGATSTTGTGDVSLIAASGDAAKRTYVTGVQVVNSGATFALITLKDGSGGSTLGYAWAPVATVGGGSTVNFNPPLPTSLNTALYFAANGASTTIFVSAQGFVGA